MRLKLCLFAVALALVLSACSTQATPTTTAKAEPVTIRIGALDDGYSNDPKSPGDANFGMYPVNVNIFESLTRLDDQFELKPCLAERWEYDEATNIWRFYLRKGVVFHNGKPFTSADVVQTINTLGTGNASGLLHIDAESATAVDEYTVRIASTVKNGQLPGMLAHHSYGIRQKDSDPFSGEHIGTGPFRFVEYKKGDSLTVERNPDYWGTPAIADQLIFKFLPDPVSRVMGLRSGDLDVILDPSPEQADKLQSESAFKVLLSGAGSMQTLDMMTNAANTAYAQPLSDEKLRQAIGYAIDRTAIAQQVYFGFVDDTQSYLPQEMLRGQAGLIQGYTYDPAKARQLLAESGWTDTNGDGIVEKDGKALELTMINGFPSLAQNGASGELIQANLQAVGIKLNLVTAADRATAFALLSKQEFHLLLSTFSQNSGSACFLPGFMYWGRWPSPGDWPKAFAPILFDTVLGNLYDDQIDHCNAALTQDEAGLAAASALHIVVDQARTVFPIVSVKRLYATGADIVGVSPHPVPGMMRWDTVTRQ